MEEISGTNSGVTAGLGDLMMQIPNPFEESDDLTVKAQCGKKRRSVKRSNIHNEHNDRNRDGNYITQSRRCFDCNIS